VTGRSQRSLPKHLMFGLEDSIEGFCHHHEVRRNRNDQAFIAVIVAISILWASNAIAQTAEPQPAAKIVVDPPLAELLSRGVVFIQYRTENLQIVPVFGPKALDVSPRIGHLHVAVDGAPWVWAETSGGPIIIAGLPAGPHKAEITPVNANHQPLDRSVVVDFVIPGKAAK